MNSNLLLDSKQLLFFKRTAELEHMTRAAEELNVSQPFLSNSISALETALGVKLFDHKGRGIVLNEYGKSFYRHVVRIFNEAEDAFRELREMEQGENNHISIATNCALYLPSLFKYLKQEIPDLNISMTTLRRNKMLKLLSEGRIDFAITAPGVYGDPDLANIPILHEKATIIHSANHWLKDYSQYPLRDLMTEPFIAVAEGYALYDSIQNTLNLNGITLPVVVKTTDTTSTLPFVKQGLGIALVPLTVAMDDSELRYCHTMPSDIKLEGTICLIYRKNQYINETSRKFIELTKQHFFKQEKLYIHQ